MALKKRRDKAMESIVFWQQGAPDGEEKLAQIKEWWQNLAGKDILWQQRPIPEDKNIDGVNWEIQKFDEEFSLPQTDLRGITLYWYRDNTERNLTPSALRLDRQAQTLDVIPDSTRNYFVRITSKEPTYQTIRLTAPLLEIYPGCIVFKDSATMTAVEVAITPAQAQQIAAHFPL
jgi:hypothetical protein